MADLTFVSLTSPNQNPDLARRGPNTEVRALWRISIVSLDLCRLIPVPFNPKLSLKSSKDSASGGAPLRKTSILSSTSSTLRRWGSGSSSGTTSSFFPSSPFLNPETLLEVADANRSVNGVLMSEVECSKTLAKPQRSSPHCTSLKPQHKKKNW